MSLRNSFLIVFLLGIFVLPSFSHAYVITTCTNYNPVDNSGLNTGWTNNNTDCYTDHDTYGFKLVDYSDHSNIYFMPYYNTYNLYITNFMLSGTIFYGSSGGGTDIASLGTFVDGNYWIYAEQDGQVDWIPFYVVNGKFYLSLSDVPSTIPNMPTSDPFLDVFLAISLWLIIVFSFIYITKKFR